MDKLQSSNFLILLDLGNTYKFHKKAHSLNKSTTNNGLCVSSQGGDYYDKVEEILEVEYPGYPIKTAVLFKCHWYDPTPNIGVKVHKQYNLVEINVKRKYNKFKTIVLALQATHVCYIPYLSQKTNNSDWWVVFNVKPHGWTDVRENHPQKYISFQEDEV